MVEEVICGPDRALGVELPRLEHAQESDVVTFRRMEAFVSAVGLIRLLPRTHPDALRSRQRDDGEGFSQAAEVRCGQKGLGQRGGKGELGKHAAQRRQQAVLIEGTQVEKGFESGDEVLWVGLIEEFEV